MAWIDPKANREAKSSSRAVSVALKACTIDPVTGERKEETESERSVRFRMRSFKPRKQRAAAQVVPQNVVRVTVTDQGVVQDPREFGPSLGHRVSRIRAVPELEPSSNPPVQQETRTMSSSPDLRETLLAELNAVRKLLGMSEV